MNTIQKISLIVAGISLSYWFFAAIDSGFELFDFDYWEDGFDKWYLQLSLSIFVGSIISYFVFNDKDRSIIINIKKTLDSLRNTVNKYQRQIIIFVVLILAFIFAVSLYNQIKLMDYKKVDDKKVQKLYDKYMDKARKSRFSAAKVSKIKGTGAMNVTEGNERYPFVVELYNGSSWKINTIYIDVDIYSKNKDGSEGKFLVKRKIDRTLDEYRGLPYSKLKIYFYGRSLWTDREEDLPFLEEEYQTFSWSITSVFGEPPKK